MKIETVPIDSIHADPENARKHSEKNITAIAASLSKFGQVTPIVVDAKNAIRKGNGTWRAAKSIGWKDIKILRVKLAGADATSYAIADNRTSELAEWDDSVLTAQLQSLHVGDAELMAAAGFTDADLEEMVKKMAGEPPAEPPADDKDSGGGGGVGLGNPVVQYAIIFDDEQQQRRWFNFLRYLKKRYPEPETLAARLDLYLETVDLT